MPEAFFSHCHCGAAWPSTGRELAESKVKPLKAYFPHLSGSPDPGPGGSGRSGENSGADVEAQGAGAGNGPHPGSGGGTPLRAQVGPGPARLLLETLADRGQRAPRDPESPMPGLSTARASLPSLWPCLPLQSLEHKVGHLCQRRPGAAHGLSHKQREMMDSWWQLRTKAQKWYEPPGPPPSLTLSLQNLSLNFPSVPVSPLRFCIVNSLIPSTGLLCAEGIKG